jgi:glycosyltransferase involved in cell wall biosynthesis
MKALIVSPFYPPDLGGISYHVKNLVTRLASRGWDITVIACSRRGPTHGLDPKLELVRAIYLPGWPIQTLSSFSVPIGFSRTFQDLIRESRPDLVHFHGHHYPITWIAAAIAYSDRLPTLLTLHGTYSLNPRKPYGKSIVEGVFNRTIFTSLLQMSDAIIGVSSNVVEYAQNFLVGHRASYVIPNGIDVQRYLIGLDRKFELRKKYDFPSDAKVVLFTGRFTYVKGVLELAESAKYFRDQGTSVLFVLAGSGPLERKLREMSSQLKNLIVLDWTSFLKVTGTAAYDQIPELYLASDIFVLPSRWEAQGISTIEAMASHLHVVATPVAGAQRLLEGYPRKTFTRGFAPIDIARAVQEAIGRADEGVRPDPRVIEYVYNFDWDTVIRKTEAAYLQVIRSRATTGA